MNILDELDNSIVDTIIFARIYDSYEIINDNEAFIC